MKKYFINDDLKNIKTLLIKKNILKRKLNEPLLFLKLCWKEMQKCPLGFHVYFPYADDFRQIDRKIEA